MMILFSTIRITLRQTESRRIERNRIREDLFMSYVLAPWDGIRLPAAGPGA
jgi:hypothetical protein